MGGTVKCSGAAKIKPPFEMGVDNLDYGFSKKYSHIKRRVVFTKNIIA